MVLTIEKTIKIHFLQIVINFNFVYFLLIDSIFVDAELATYKVGALEGAFTYQLTACAEAKGLTEVFH